VETVSRDRANIALALGLLNDPAGRDELKGMCGDENFPPEFRLYAVRYMFDLGIEGDEGCLHAAEEVVRVFDSENRSVGNRVTALELLVRFRNLTQEESQTVFDLVIRGLDDPEATMRMQASSALATLDDQDAVLTCRLQ
jgi:HEAT repeat protein